MIYLNPRVVPYQLAENSNRPIKNEQVSEHHRNIFLCLVCFSVLSRVIVNVQIYARLVWPPPQKKKKIKGSGSATYSLLSHLPPPS